MWPLALSVPRVRWCALLVLLATLLSFRAAQAQKPDTYKMEFVRAGWVGIPDHSMVLVVLKVTPTIPDFKLIMSMRLAYDIGAGEQAVDIQKFNNVKVDVFGSDAESKDPKIYNFIKEKVDLDKEKDIYLLRFALRDISKEPVTQMKFTYGLWESNDPETRHEATYSFAVERLTK